MPCRKGLRHQRALGMEGCEVKEFMKSTFQELMSKLLSESVWKAIKFITIINIIATVVALAWVLLTSGATPAEEPKQELQFAKIYQSPMVVAEIKHQAPEPVEVTTSSAQKEESGKSNAIITHYCACSSCNGKWSYTEKGLNYTQTASGFLLYDGIGGNYCAATFGNLGDILSINGVDYKIVDRMGGNSGKRIDIFVSEGHEKCNELGRYTAEVELKK